MGLKLNTASSGSVTIEPTNTASNYTLTAPATNATLAINGPAFSAYQSSAQTLSSLTLTKLLFQTEEFDTNSNYDTSNSRFTPTVAGYYQVTTSFGVSASNCSGQLRLFKNGTNVKFLQSLITNVVDTLNGSALVYCNGTTDYLEIYGYLSVGQALAATSTYTYFQASMVRSA